METGGSVTHEVVIGVGSNCGDRAAAMAMALDWLRGQLCRVEVSAVYETDAVGSDPRPYLNAVVIGQTALSDRDFDARLKGYELLSGRDASARARGDVPVDIDLVASAGTVLRPRDFASAFFRTGYAELMNARLVRTSGR